MAPLLAKFLPRDMHKRDLCRRAVSVCMVSVTFAHCVETAKDTAMRIGNRAQAFEWYNFQ